MGPSRLDGLVVDVIASWPQIVKARVVLEPLLLLEDVILPIELRPSPRIYVIKARANYRCLHILKSLHLGCERRGLFSASRVRCVSPALVIKFSICCIVHIHQRIAELLLTAELLRCSALC